ncbi:type IV pilin [Natronorubrum sulfidifaciens]|uniref:Archaeal Type IV pilin N-terminal domain-containing protein n=1 Tax=Natronorubrum sulfidifaciens JCM 14089 TaxID=1230460 RepID=L9VZF1_9EURY|nr:type IV pilin N-terminal domain-containing protein [Natronorubrum sulfidifaciens]ELY42560.1 hypothetical protein C495_14642 [Natronorubrum sulfidifaciens JCM 14089]
MTYDLSQYTTKLIGSKDERAVSPVIGVILMVAITVILAAVIAAFVLDIGDLDDSAPNAQFDWENTSDGVEVTHTSGDDINLDPVTVQIDFDGDKSAESDLSDSSSDEFTAGDTMEIDENGVDFDGNTDWDGDSISDPDEIDEVTITWESDGSSTIIANYEP